MEPFNWFLFGFFQTSFLIYVLYTLGVYVYVKVIFTLKFF